MRFFRFSHGAGINGFLVQGRQVSRNRQHRHLVTRGGVFRDRAARAQRLIVGMRRDDQYSLAHLSPAMTVGSGIGSTKRPPCSTYLLCRRMMSSAKFHAKTIR